MAYIVLYSFKFNAKTARCVGPGDCVGPRRAKPCGLGLIWGRIGGDFGEKLYGWIRCRYSLLRTVFDRGGVRPVRGTPLYSYYRNIGNSLTVSAEISWTRAGVSPRNHHIKTIYPL